MAPCPTSADHLGDYYTDGARFWCRDCRMLLDRPVYQALLATRQRREFLEMLLTHWSAGHDPRDRLQRARAARIEELYVETLFGIRHREAA